jgi:hypothetical protein
VEVFRELEVTGRAPAELRAFIDAVTHALPQEWNRDSECEADVALHGQQQAANFPLAKQLLPGLTKDSQC